VQLYGVVVSFIWLCTQNNFPFCEFGEGNFSNSSICSSVGMLCVIYTVLCILSISAKEFSVMYLGWCRCMICVICILCISTIHTDVETCSVSSVSFLWRNSLQPMRMLRHACILCICSVEEFSPTNADVEACAVSSVSVLWRNSLQLMRT
jgi:hypothetical protein